MITHTGQRTTNGQRPGFTLIELLVVVAIIGILVALSAGAVIRYIGVQQKNNTETLIRKVQTKLQDHWRSVYDQANKEVIPDNIKRLAGGDERAARVFYIKLRLRQEFPRNYAEAVNPALLPPIRTYQEAVWQAVPGARGVTTLPSVDDPAQNSACLLLALTQARKGATALSAADIGTSALGDTNNDGLQEIIDGWGKPIVLIRFPYKHPALNPGPNYPQDPTSFGPQQGLNDDVDTQGLLVRPNFAGRTEFERLLHPIPAASGSPQTYRLFPVLVSGGPNRVLGIDPNGGIVGNPSDSNDNLYNYNLFKLGARGD